jgi:hypothetical protein
LAKVLYQIYQEFLAYAIVKCTQLTAKNRTFLVYTYPHQEESPKGNKRFRTKAKEVVMKTNNKMLQASRWIKRDNYKSLLFLCFW